MMLEMFIFFGVIFLIMVIVSVWSVRFSKEPSILSPEYIRAAQFFAQLDEEHQSGWRVILNGECLGELDFVYGDSPFMIFRFTPCTDDTRKINYALCSNLLQEPDPGIEFENRVSKMRVEDGPFCVRLRETGEVSIRDFRMPPPISSSGNEAG